MDQDGCAQRQSGQCPGTSTLASWTWAERSICAPKYLETGGAAQKASMVELERIEMVIPQKKCVYGKQESKIWTEPLCCCCRGLFFLFLFFPGWKANFSIRLRKRQSQRPVFCSVNRAAFHEMRIPTDPELAALSTAQTGEKLPRVEVLRFWYHQPSTLTNKMFWTKLPELPATDKEAQQAHSF